MDDEQFQTFEVSWTWGPETIKTVVVEATSPEEASEKAYEALGCIVKATGTD
jgi:hypothetical protein